MRKIITVSLALGLSTILMAKANIDNSAFKASLSKIAGEKGVFAQNEVFPKDYFLISKNLPFLVGLTLHHPMSSTLELSKEQIEKIQTIKSDTMPTVIKSVKEIKALELALSDKIYKDAKAEDLSKEVEKIGSLKVALTKAHLDCIEAVREVLTPVQREKILTYIGGKKDDNATKR